jgi:GxxExxY protein
MVECRGDELTERVIACIIKVHQTLGAGFLEVIYRNALIIELAKQGLTFEIEKEVLVFYEGHPVGRHRLDLVVEGQLVLELKTVSALAAIHYAQIRSYLKATGIAVGLLINFNNHHADFRRVTVR